MTLPDVDPGQRFAEPSLGDGDVAGLRGRLLPGWALTVGVLVVGGLLIGVALSGRPTGPLDAAPGLVCLLLAAGAPNGPLPGLFLVVVAATQVLAGGPTGWADLAWRLPLEAAGLHAVHVLSGIAATVPRQARVEARALRPALGRFVAAQLLALPVYGAVVALAAAYGLGGHGGIEAPQGWLLVSAAFAVALAAAPVALISGRRSQARRGP